MYFIYVIVKSKSILHENPDPDGVTKMDKKTTY